ncbi:MAG: DUF342 domain-containing protein [Lachnospiraceae bacterium]|nr:DUF342 domain-containing protein [Lachnospiraceae bacterium]
MPIGDVLELNTNTEPGSGELDEKLYERELALCGGAGADVQELREKGFNVFQLEQIRQGLQEGVDVSVYMDGRYSWLDMEEIRKGLKQGVDMTAYREAGYSTAQKREIRKGIARGLDVSLYDKKDLLSEQMKQIRLGLQEKLPVVFYNTPGYSASQMEEIRKGLSANLDISAYASADMPYLKMRAIRESMEDGLYFLDWEIAEYDAETLEQLHQAYLAGVDIMPYIKKGYNPPQLEQIRISLQEGLKFEPYIRKDMRGESLREIRLGLEANVDVKAYAKEEYTWPQMRELRLGLEKRVDTGQYANPLFTSNQMRQIRLGLESGLDVSRYNHLIYTSHDMREMRQALQRGEDVRMRLYEWPEIPEKYEDPVLPKAMRPDRNLLRQAIEKEAAALKARKEGTAPQGTAPVLPSAADVPAELFGAGASKAMAAPQVDMQGHHVLITEDKMFCYLSLPKPSEGVVYTEEMVHALLARMHVRAGIDDNAIRAMLRDGRYDEQVVVASGAAPVNGTDGRYEYFFDRNASANPKFDGNGAADYTDVRFFTEVKVGDQLAAYTPGEKGRDGFNVRGEVLPARNGLERPVLKGRGFMLLEDKRTYAAAVSGVVKMNGYELNINRLLTVEEGSDIPRRIEFLGSVHVKAELPPGTEIAAQGDLIVDTVAESLKIKCGGDVILKNGGTGRSPGVIEAEGSVSARNLVNYEVHAKGSVFANSVLQCNIATEEKVVCFGENGTIYGGRVEAKLGVECAVIGSRTDTHTVICIGVTGKMWSAYHEAEKRVERLKQELETLQTEMDRLAGIHLQSKEQLQWKIKIGAAHTIKEKEHEEAVREMEQQAAYIRSVEGAEALVSRILHANTTFIVDETIMNITETKETESGIVIKGREKHWKTSRERN